jgi:hypothetical protein
MRELVEAEKTATALVKALKSDLATEKADHDQQVGDRDLRASMHLPAVHGCCKQVTCATLASSEDVRHAWHACMRVSSKIPVGPCAGQQQQLEWVYLALGAVSVSTATCKWQETSSTTSQGSITSLAAKCLLCQLNMHVLLLLECFI